MDSRNKQRCRSPKAAPRNAYTGDGYSKFRGAELRESGVLICYGGATGLDCAILKPVLILKMLIPVYSNQLNHSCLTHQLLVNLC